MSELLACPNPYAVDHTVLCGCPGDVEYRQRHWVVNGVPFFCPCAPYEIPERGSGVWTTGNPDGYACSSCSRQLPDRALMRRLNCDMWCCWCGNLAEGNRGYRIYGHPARKDAA